MADLAELGIHVAIDEVPNELPEPVRFSQDNRHASYARDGAAIRDETRLRITALEDSELVLVDAA